MPRFRVESLEKFVVRTVYLVTARSPKQAEQLCRSGQAAYDEHQIEEGDEEWLKTVSITIQGAATAPRHPTPRSTRNLNRRPRARSGLKRSRRE